MFSDPTFWTLVAFIAFFAAVAKPAIKIITGGLDDRAAKIKADIEEAETLCKEAQDLLAKYQKKQRDAAKDAEDIAAHAKEEAKRVAEQGKARLEASLARREKLAMDRIAQAEAAALEEVRRRTVNIALDATRDLLATKLSGAKSDALIDGAIKDLPGKLH